MGRIVLATSNSTDEEYGGTFPLDASDIPYDANTTVKQAIDKKANKNWIELGWMTSSTSQTLPLNINEYMLLEFNASHGNCIGQVILPGSSIPNTITIKQVDGDTYITSSGRTLSTNDTTHHIQIWYR